ncbi:MAG: DUF305 domain-containing protein [Lacisediminihabitans sp.]
MKLIHRSALVVAALAVTAVLSACTSAGTSSTTSSSATLASHNTADTAFAQSMIVHHQGAIQMAELAATRASSTPVKELAAQIKAAQQPEIDQMTSWLKEWGEPMTGSGTDTSAPMPSDMPGMDMSTPTASAMPGMSDGDMSALAAASGTSFDRTFLTLMTQHHQGAITMAKDELVQGLDARAKKLAQSIIDSQTKEIDSMKSMLSALG